jgi:hypothetical protein
MSNPADTDRELKVQVLSLEYQTLRGSILMRTSARYQFLGFTTAAAEILATGRIVDPLARTSGPWHFWPGEYLSLVLAHFGTLGARSLINQDELQKSNVESMNWCQWIQTIGHY